MDVPLFKICWDNADIERVSAVIRKGSFWAIGPEIAAFERKVAEYFGVKHAIGVNSGTSALHATLAAYEIGKGDEVIVPSFTFIATANAPMFVGAVPVFADIDEDTYGLDPNDVVRKITPRTRAIVPVHYGGGPCHIRELKEIAELHNLLLVEDAAESFGATHEAKCVGTFGDAAILSFCANKVITTGEGGMVLTDSDDLCQRVKLLRSHGRAETANPFSSGDATDYVSLGYNYRMSTMTAALGLAQMEKVDRIIRLRQQNAAYMTGVLSDLIEIQPPKVQSGATHVYQLYTIRVLNHQGARDRLQRYLAARSIMTKVYFPPVHLTTFYRRLFSHGEGLLPVTERMASEVLTLPMCPDLTRAEMDYVAESIAGFFSDDVKVRFD